MVRRLPRDPHRPERRFLRRARRPLAAGGAGRVAPARGQPLSRPLAAGPLPAPNHRGAGPCGMRLRAAAMLRRPGRPPLEKPRGCVMRFCSAAQAVALLVVYGLFALTLVAPFAAFVSVKATLGAPLVAARGRGLSRLRHAAAVDRRAGDRRQVDCHWPLSRERISALGDLLFSLVAGEQAAGDRTYRLPRRHAAAGSVLPTPRGEGRRPGLSRQARDRRARPGRDRTPIPASATTS